MKRYKSGSVPASPSGARSALLVATGLLLLLGSGGLVPSAAASPNATRYGLQGLSLANTCNPHCADLSPGTSFGYNEGDWWPAQLEIEAGSGACVSSACTITVDLDYRMYQHSTGSYVYAIDAFAACGPIYPGAVSPPASEPQPSGQDSVSGQCGKSTPPPYAGATATPNPQYAGGDNGPGTLYEVLVCDSSFSCSAVPVSMVSGHLGTSWIIPSSSFNSPYIGEADQAVAFTLSVGPFASGSVHYVEWANHLTVTGQCTYQGNCGTASGDTDTADAANTLGASHWPGARIHMNSDLAGVVPGVRDVPIFVGVTPTFASSTSTSVYDETQGRVVTIDGNSVGTGQAGDSYHDVVTVTGTCTSNCVGATPPNPTGTVNEEFFTGSTCDPSNEVVGPFGSANWPETITLPGTANPAIVNSQSTGPLPAGSYSFLADYSGDSAYSSSANPNVCEPLSGSPSTGVPEFPLGSALVIALAFPVLYAFRLRFRRTW